MLNYCILYRKFVPLDIILKEIFQTIDMDSISKFNICRTRVWDGVVRALKRKSFSPTHRMSVKFTDDYGQSEGAVDFGGPTRELLTLVMLELEQSSMFTSTPNNTGKLIENFGPGLHKLFIFMFACNKIIFVFWFLMVRFILAS